MNSPTMQADYHDAHKRHWDDAETLNDAQRWANADHLFGLAAECGLKRLMMAFGMPFDKEKDKPEKAKDRVHADGAWARYESCLCGHHRGAAYALAGPNPFADWHIAQRYAHQSQFDGIRITGHRGGAEDVRRLVKKAAREGLI